MLTTTQLHALWQRRSLEIRQRWLDDEHMTWPRAAHHVALSLTVLEARAILEYLAARPALCSHDRLFAEALAARLRLSLTWARRPLVG